MVMIHVSCSNTSLEAKNTMFRKFLGALPAELDHLLHAVDAEA